MRAKQLETFKIGLALRTPFYVRATGLTSRPDLNGVFAQVAARLDPESGRLPTRVFIYNEAQSILVKADNLVPTLITTGKQGGPHA